MPIFEYACPACRTEFEILIKKDGKALCPSCGNDEPVKKLSLFATARSAASAIPGSAPDCASACQGFAAGSCGSGLCGGHHHG
ncbi:MAG TPA: zinc ribbon domain-containing protein [Spirochaetia bacterium]|nr:zinc ribbon domain-containing protein [Spirochaetia bacterium]